MEDRRAWRINALKPKWYTLWMKPIAKIGQLFGLSAIGSQQSADGSL